MCVFTTLIIYLMCSFLSIFVLILLHCFSIHCRLQYKGTPKYLGESVTGVEIGVQNSCSGSCMVGKGKEVGDISRCTGKLA